MTSTSPSAAPPRIPREELPSRIFRLLFRTANLVRQTMAPFFESHGISTTQWVILHMLKTRAEGGEPDVRLVDLSRRLSVRQPSLTPIVNRLVAAGLLERVAAVADKRERRVRISAAGRRMIERMARAHRERQSQVVAAWDETEQRQAVGLLMALLEHLENTEGAASGAGCGGHCK